MKGLFLKAPAFACVAVYLALGWHYISAMIAATTRNFHVLYVVPCLMGAVVFLVYGLLLSEKMPPKSSVKVGVLNVFISFGPYILLALLLSPKVLTAMPPESWKDCVLPLLMSLYPFAVALWGKATRKL